MGSLHDKAAWHRRARRQLQYEPLCAMCLSEGRIVAARIADHVEPHHNDPIKFWNGKLQSLGTRAARNGSNIPGSTMRSESMVGPSILGTPSTASPMGTMNRDCSGIGGCCNSAAECR